MSELVAEAIGLSGDTAGVAAADDAAPSKADQAPAAADDFWGNLFELREWARAHCALGVLRRSNPPFDRATHTFSLSLSLSLSLLQRTRSLLGLRRRPRSRAQS